MEGNTIQLTGEEFEFALVEVLSKIKEDIRLKRSEAKEGERLKAMPLITLLDEGCLTKEFIVKETPKLQNKTSTLSSAKRKQLSMIITAATRRAWINKQVKLQEEQAKAEENKSNK